MPHEGDYVDATPLGADMYRGNTGMGLVSLIVLLTEMPPRKRSRMKANITSEPSVQTTAPIHSSGTSRHIPGLSVAQAPTPQQHRAVKEFEEGLLRTQGGSALK